MKLIDCNKEINIKNYRVQEIILCLLVFIIVPIVNIVLAMAGDESPVFTSISRMTWVSKMVYVPILIGLFNFSTFFYALYHTLQTGKYVKGAKIFAYVFAAISMLTICVGLAVPAYYAPEDEYYTTLRTVHAILCGAGIVLEFGVIIFIAVTTFYRNKMQGFIEVMICCVMLISAVFTILVVNDADSYCTTSAVSQIFMFSIYNIALAIFSIFNKTFKEKTNE